MACTHTAARSVLRAFAGAHCYDRNATLIHSARLRTTTSHMTSIHGPKADGTHLVEFGRPEAEVLAISVPRGSDPTLPGTDAIVPDMEAD